MIEKFRLDITGISRAALRVYLSIALEQFHETVTLEKVYNCLGGGCYSSKGLFDGVMLIISANSLDEAGQFSQTLQGAVRGMEVHMFPLSELEL